MATQGILLETGTNEVEIIEFYLAGQSFGVNVAKVKQIVQFREELITRVPNSSKSVAGLFLFRNVPITLIDLHEAVDLHPEEATHTPLVLVTEFSNVTTGFLIDGVNRIHRISWNDLQPMNSFLEGVVSSFTGSINIEGREILIIDLERIVAEINPECKMASSETSGASVRKDLSGIKVVLAEDSTFIRKELQKSLAGSGFTVVNAFDNGLSAFDFIREVKEKCDKSASPVTSIFDIIVTDIEMPKMDGLTLCRNTKSMGLNVPVIAFSSLINEQMAAKCKSVGVDSYIAKPNMDSLRELILKHCPV